MLARFRDIHILVYTVYNKSRMSRMVLYVLPCSVTVSSGRKIEKILGFGTSHCSIYDLDFQLIAQELRSIKIDNDTCFMIVPNSWLNNELSVCNSSLSFYSTSIFAIFSDSSCFWNDKLFWMSIFWKGAYKITNSKMGSVLFSSLFLLKEINWATLYWQQKNSTKVSLHLIFVHVRHCPLLVLHYLWGTRKEDLVED